MPSYHPFHARAMSEPPSEKLKNIYQTPSKAVKGISPNIPPTPTELVPWDAPLAMICSAFTDGSARTRSRRTRRTVGLPSDLDILHHGNKIVRGAGPTRYNVSSD